MIGLQPVGRQPLLNPAMGTAIGPGDHLIVIASDDDTIQLSGRTDFAVHQ